MADQNLETSIQASLSQGKTKEAIYLEYLNAGKKVDEIEKAFDSQSTTPQEKEDTQKRTINIILTIGAILIAAGIFSFIAANWQEMDKFTKVAIIIIAMLSSYALGWFLKEKKQLQKSGETLLLLGSIIYGAGIFLVGQIFHIRANWPDGFILWMIGTLVLALGLSSYPIFTLSIILGVVAIIGYPMGIFDDFLRGGGFLQTSSFLLLAATVVVLICALLIRRKVDTKQNTYY